MRLVLAAIAAAAIAISATAAWAARESLVATSYVARMPVRGNAVVDAYQMVRSAVFFHDRAQHLTSGSSGDEEKISALVTWTNENVRPEYAAPDRAASVSPYAAALRGYGRSDLDAQTLALLASSAGYDARVVFAYWPDGLPHHALTEIRLADGWVLADAWVGTIYRDASGRRLTAEDVAAEPPDRPLYSDRILDLRAGYVARGTVAATYPGVRSTSVLSAVAGGAALPAGIVDSAPAQQDEHGPGEVVRAASVVDPILSPTPVPPTQAPTPDPSAFERQAERYARARLDQVEGRFAAAASGYRKLLDAPRLEPELARSAAFFLGLALLRAGDAAGAERVLGEELRTQPGSAWRASVLRYRGEARLASGDEEGARRDLAAAGVPSALIRLRSVSR